MHAGNQGRLDLLLKDFNFTYTSRNSDKTPPGIITVLDLNFGCKFKIRTPMDISEEVIFLLKGMLESFAAASSAEEMNSAMNAAVKTLKSNKIFSRIESAD